MPGRKKPRNPNENRGSKPGERRGGIQKGGKHKKKTSAPPIIVSGTTPLEFMLSIMQNDPPANADYAVKLAWFQLRFEAAKASAPYIHPRAQEPTKTPNTAEASRQLREALREMQGTVLNSRPALPPAESSS